MDPDQPAETIRIVVPSKLFHFSKLQFVESFLKDGEVSLGNARIYANPNMTPDQRDNECTRTSSPPADLMKIVLSKSREDLHQVLASQGGRSAIAMGNLGIVKKNEEGVACERQLGGLGSVNHRTTIAYPYYLKSFTVEYREDFYTRFSADACIEILDTFEFLKRLDASILRSTPEWQTALGFVKYYDPTSFLPFGDKCNPVFQKPSTHPYPEQREYSIAIRPTAEADLVSPQERVSGLVDRLDDIARLHRPSNH